MTNPGETSDTSTQGGTSHCKTVFQHRLELAEGVQGVPIFTGEDPSLPFNRFKSIFEKKAKFFQLTEEDKLHCVESKLGGRAEHIFSVRSKDINNMSDFYKIFEEEFAAAKDLYRLTEEFWGVFHLPGMSVAEFFSSARQKAQAIASMQNLDKEAHDQVVKSNLLTMLLKNIDPRMRRNLMAREFENVEELEKAAKLEERGIAAEQNQGFSLHPNHSQSYAVQHTATKNNDLADTLAKVSLQMKDIAERLEALESRKSNPSPKQKPKVTCFYCGIVGHRQVDCFKRKRDQDQQRNINSTRGRGYQNRNQGSYPQNRNVRFHDNNRGDLN